MSPSAKITMQHQKALRHPHCRFPTAIRRTLKESHFRAIGVFDQGDGVTAWEQDSQRLRDSVLNAWAILLRYYVRNDLVAFFTFSNSPGHHGIGDAKSKSCFGEETEIVMLQYQLLSNLQIHEIRPSESTKCTHHDMGDVRINTVVRFSRSCAKNSLQRTEIHSISTRADDASAMKNVRLDFTNVLCSPRTIDILRSASSGCESDRQCFHA